MSPRAHWEEAPASEGAFGRVATGINLGCQKNRQLGALREFEHPPGHETGNTMPQSTRNLRSGQFLNQVSLPCIRKASPARRAPSSPNHKFQAHAETSDQTNEHTTANITPVPRSAGRFSVRLNQRTERTWHHDPQKTENGSEASRS